MERGLTEDVRRTIASDPTYAAEYFDELSRRPLPVQLALSLLPRPPKALTR